MLERRFEGRDGLRAVIGKELPDLPEHSVRQLAGKHLAALDVHRRMLATPPDINVSALMTLGGLEVEAVAGGSGL